MPNSEKRICHFHYKSKQDNQGLINIVWIYAIIARYLRDDYAMPARYNTVSFCSDLYYDRIVKRDRVLKIKDTYKRNLGICYLRFLLCYGKLRLTL